MSDDDTEEVEVEATFAERLRDAQQAYDEVSEYLEGLKDELKAQFKGKKVTGVHDGVKIFTHATYETSRIDSKRLKSEWPDIYAQYTRTVESQRVSIIRPKAGS